ncbi:MAG: membrane protein insertase YidC [Phycisphaerales bacterium]|nr:membrane protein insertase YidC [Phycisphaerales bacterium]
MQSDKNTIVGFVLLAILFIAYFWYNNNSYTDYLAAQQRTKDSLAMVDMLQHPGGESVAKKKQDSLHLDSAFRINTSGSFSNQAFGKKESVTVSNDLMTVHFSNYGGCISSVELKKYKDYQQQPVILGSPDNHIGYFFNTGAQTSTSTSEMFFSIQPTRTEADGSQIITLYLSASNGNQIIHEFVVHPHSYLIDWNIKVNGVGTLFTGTNINLDWHLETHALEKNALYEKQQSDICFYENNEFDYISQHTTHNFEKPFQWVSVVQQFFDYSLIDKNNFNGGNITWQRVGSDTSTSLAKVDIKASIPLNGANQIIIPLQMYWGPNDYSILKNTATDLDKIVNLGRDLYAFVRPINKYIIMPVFLLFAGFHLNFGWVIALLTLFIRLIIAPLTYSSYKSAAKMKIMKPEIDDLKKKHGSDQQTFAMEQMKLFREAGVNPLGGCLPALLQIPIFFALYTFFNSNILLRQQSFLWCSDLASYDSIVTWKTSVWLIGNHLSLFTLTAVATSFLISLYNINMTPTQQDNPSLKYMPYIFPIILLFVFNRLPAALTWYYTVSNIVTLGIQFVVQNFIIDHEKLHLAIQQKRKQPKVQSKWQQKYQEMVEAQKKVQSLKDKTTKK